jgi:hypothetical protein
MMGMTGPKISSTAMRLSRGTSSNMVGSLTGPSTCRPPGSFAPALTPRPPGPGHVPRPFYSRGCPCSSWGPRDRRRNTSSSLQDQAEEVLLDRALDEDARNNGVAALARVAVGGLADLGGRQLHGRRPRGRWPMPSAEFQVELLSCGQARDALAHGRGSR